jgi:hypothetical protein
MRALANEVEFTRQTPKKLESTKKRKRDLEEAIRRANRVAIRTEGDDHPISPKSVKPRGSMSGSDGVNSPLTPHIATPTAELSLADLDPPLITIPPQLRTTNPLQGLQVVIIHVKDNFSDAESTGDIIMRELSEYEREVQLGCEFVISSKGDSFMF